MPEAILLKDVEGVGEKGTVVDVSKGYLRNFLIPRKLAQPATRNAVDAAKAAGVDLVVLAVPCAGLPAVLDELGLRMSERAAVLVTSKGLVPPLGTTPTAFASERVHARAVATFAVPAGSRQVVEQGATGVVATRDLDLRRQLRDVLGAGGLAATVTDDVTGIELAACAKTAAALARSAAARKGAAVAGAASTRIVSEIEALALASGGRSETLSAAGTPAGRADSLATLRLLALAFERQRIDAPATIGLWRVTAGESTTEEWLKSLGAERPKETTPAA